jgi:hypothetical protein
VLILESAAASILVLGSVLILRACWEGDTEPRKTRSLRRVPRPKAKARSMGADHKRAA